jgi:hypothetical protein
MKMSSFETNPKQIKDILLDVEKGDLQLPDFQRGWVWNENSIRELVVSVLKGFPIGALMTLEVGGEVNVTPHVIEGVKKEKTPIKPSQLILDGQQRTTSLFLSMFYKGAIKTKDDKENQVLRHFYIDINNTMMDNFDIADSVKIVPENKKLKELSSNVDLSTREKEFDNLFFPLNMAFDWPTWQSEYLTYITKTETGEKLSSSIARINNFYKIILEPLNSYKIPVIKLDKNTTKEAVCLVFEKVNTGGKPLDVFELITAIYAADNHKLRDDWYGKTNDDGDAISDGIEENIHSTAVWANQGDGVLTGVSSTDFFQVISLLYTESRHIDARNSGKTGKALPQISATKKSILDIPLSEYLKYKDLVEKSFITAGAFLTRIGIYRLRDLPYQSQVTALAAIISKIKGGLDNTAVFKNLERWYWCGVFGELYGSSIETRIAYDFVQVSPWVIDNTLAEPFTIRDANFSIGRLDTMRSKLSAAYKGLSALIAKSGAKDYITGEEYNQTIFMSQEVDIDHIFPKKWCKEQGIEKDIYDSIINKTPISPKTNRGVVSGKAPGKFIDDIEKGDPKNKVAPISGQQIDENLASHLIDPSFLRKDDFNGFYNDRRKRLANLIEKVMGKPVNRQ